jgi:aldehyde dehydrogenase (NAD+)
MTSAPADTPSPDDLTYRLYIDGAWVDSDGPGVTEVGNPATGDVIGRVPQATRSDVARAAEAARRAFDDGPWPRTTPAERAAVMIRMADAMKRRLPELVELNIAEAGATRALAQTRQVADPIRQFRDLAERVVPTFAWERPLAPVVGVGIGQGVLRREAFGVAALVSAYNFPMFLNLSKLGPALAAGCTTVLKPAPTTPLEALVLGEIADEAGLPAGVLNIVTGDVEAGEELTTNALVDLVSFTGSDSVGRAVYQQAAASMKKVVLELGGKSANIVCDDADLDRVLPGIVAGIVAHAGQGCALLTRTVVHESRRDELVDKVVAALQRVVVGDPAAEGTTMGPLISEAQRDRVEALIRSGQEQGAKLAFGGGRPAGLDRGWFVEPTLFVDVDNSMDIAQKEFFGPVGVVISVADDEEAVRVANDSPFGLSGSVWAKDPVRAYEIARRIRTGTVTINGGGGGSNPDTAFGGYKQSGIGREWGAHGIDEFLQTQCVMWGVAGG